MMDSEVDLRKLSRLEIFQQYLDTLEKTKAVSFEIFGQPGIGLEFTTNDQLRQGVEKLLRRGELEKVSAEREPEPAHIPDETTELVLQAVRRAGRTMFGGSGWFTRDDVMRAAGKLDLDVSLQDVSRTLEAFAREGVLRTQKRVQFPTEYTFPVKRTEDVVRRLVEQTDTSGPEPVPPYVTPGGRRDFRAVETRRVEGALGELQALVSALKAEINKQRDAGNWDLDPKDLSDYDYLVGQMQTMVGRLEDPYY